MKINPNTAISSLNSTGTSTVSDIIKIPAFTWYKQAESVIAKNEDFSHILINNLPFAVAMFDCEIRYLAITKRWESDYSLDNCDVIGKSHYEIFPEISERWRGIHRRGFMGETVRADEDRFERADGTIQWLKWGVQPWYRFDGAVGGIIIFSEDITVRKQVEEQTIALLLMYKRQQESEGRLSLVTHDAGIGIWDYNLVSNELVWDDSMFELYHINREDFSNAVDAWKKSLHPEDHQRAEHEIQEALNNIKPFDTQFRIIWPNGEVRHIKATAKVFFDDKGVPLSMLGTTRDVTEITLVDRMKSEFIATAAHELRTPMTSIFGYTELLKNMDFDVETQKEMISTIYDQSKAMIGLLNDVLDMAKMEAEVAEVYQMTPQPIGPILKALADTLVTPDNRNKVILEITPNLPDVNVDKTRIEQAVRNLLRNAFKFSPNHEPIKMLVTEVMQNQQRKVLIVIEDHGIGMTPEQLQHVYDRFYRADQSGKESGTGLGMTIVREIIIHHGGTIEIESKLGVGTKVMLYLPVA